MKQIDKLKDLYAKTSKHSNYQILTDKLAGIIGNDQIEVKSRFEQERLDFICKSINVSGKKVLDIGGNTGFFSFKLLEKGASEIHYCEGNKNHSDFVKLAAEVLQQKNQIQIDNSYFVFDGNDNRKYDIILLLNVLHHVGDDYGDNTLTIERAKETIIKQLNSLAYKTDYIVFQLGFCWKGNRNVGLFENGTKTEMIEFIRKGIENFWQIEKIGIAEIRNESIVYTELNKENIERNDALGEFLNRPIFIMKSKRYE